MKKNLINFLYNIDRAVASLFGAPPQETISSEIGRHANSNFAARLLRKILDTIEPKHCENAEVHADLLDRADNGQEQ